MKTLFTSLAILAFSATCFAQNSPVPSADIKTLDGKTVNTSSFENDGKPYVISFWATWCKPCIRELTAIAENYEDWQEETGMKLIAVSIDDARNSRKVMPFINGMGWDYEVYLDANQDFKRKMNVNGVPHTFLVDGNNKIVWSHNSYAAGDEYHLYELIEKLSNGESIDE